MINATAMARESLTRMIRRAPPRPPTNMAKGESRRRPTLDDVPPARGPSAKMPVIVRVNTVVVKSGTASFRATVFWVPIATPSRTMSTWRAAPDPGVAAVSGDDHGCRDEDRFDGGGDGQEPNSPDAHVRGKSAPRDGAEAKRAQRDQGSGDREAARTGERESQEDHVPGHVGDEHVAEDEIAERVHQAGDDGQGHEEWGKRPVGSVPGRHGPSVCEWGAHDVLPAQPVRIVATTAE